MHVYIPCLLSPLHPSVLLYTGFKLTLIKITPICNSVFVVCTQMFQLQLILKYRLSLNIKYDNVLKIKIEWEETNSTDVSCLVQMKIIHRN